MGFNSRRTEGKAYDAGRSLGLFSILGIVFITLKLCGQIAWSWWWVLAPFWGWPLTVILGALVAFFVISFRD